MSTTSDATRRAAWKASDEGKAAEAAWDVAEAAACDAYEAAEDAARAAYCTSCAAYLAKALAPVTP